MPALRHVRPQPGVVLGLAPLTLPRAFRALILLPGFLSVACALPVRPVAAAEVPDFRHWKALRDQGVVRQEKDFSCGLAALATMLTYYFDIPVSEAELLDRLELPDPERLGRVLSGVDRAPGERAQLQMLQERGVSLAILADLARDYGLRAQGVSLAAQTLSRLSIPAIAYIEPDGEPHFTLIRGVDGRGNVQVADPSWGNRLFSAPDFARVFALGEEAAGRLLLIGSADGSAGREDWFVIDRAQPRIQLPQPLR